MPVKTRFCSQQHSAFRLFGTQTLVEAPGVGGLVPRFATEGQKHASSCAGVRGWSSETALLP